MIYLPRISLSSEDRLCYMLINAQYQKQREDVMRQYAQRLQDIEKAFQRELFELEQQRVDEEQS